MGQKFLNIKQTAELLGVHPITVVRHCKMGILPYYQIGSRKRFLLEDLNNFLKGARYDATKQQEDPFRVD